MIVAAALMVACDSTPTSQAPPLVPPSSVSADAGGRCDPTTVDQAFVIVRFALDGACLPGSSMVLYRCSPSDVPVLRVASEGGSVSFLGGPFAVMVDTVPANVRFVGRGGGYEVLVSDPIPGVADPTSSAAEAPDATELGPLVYVRHDGVTERWLRLERRRAVSQPPIAWLIGDSILDGGREALADPLADWSLTIDAEVGRPSSQGVPLAAAASEADADVVLVELGTNDSAPTDFRDHLVETLDLLRAVPLVLWQTARGPVDDTTIGPVNEAIREIIPRYPNTAIADWEAFVPADELMDDGIHPLEGSEDLESELLTPILTAWRGAVSGEGSTSCGRRVVRASS
jgi:hypothetical protein